MVMNGLLLGGRKDMRMRAAKTIFMAGDYSRMLPPNILYLVSSLIPHKSYSSSSYYHTNHAFVGVIHHHY